MAGLVRCWLVGRLCVERPELSQFEQPLGARPAAIFQTISEKTEAHDGRLRIGTAERLGRDTVEACRSIDVNRLHKTGCLRAGWAGGWQWTSDGEKVASINLRAEADRLHLSYRVRIGGGEWEDVAETVAHRPRALPLRRCRPYFICPGVVNGIACGRRVAKLHGAGALFPVPPLLSPRPCQPERGRMGPDAAARQQDQTAPRWRSRHGRAIPAEAEGHVAANLRAAARASLRRRRCSPTKPSRSRPNGCWRGSTTRNPRGVSGDERDQPDPAGRDRRHRHHPLQRAAPRRAVALHRAAVGGCRRVPAPWSTRWWPSTRRRDRPRSIWSRNSPASCGASAAYAWPRPLPIVAGWTERFRHTGKRRRRRWCILEPPTSSEGVSDAIRATATDTEEDTGRHAADEAMTRHALDLLGSTRNDAYEAALAALREDTRKWWADMLARDPDELEKARGADHRRREGLRRFLESEVLPWFETRKKELANRPLIREQAFGEALDPDKLERLGRYEVHLDRKLERMLTMLLRLKDLRQSGDHELIRLAKHQAEALPGGYHAEVAGKLHGDS